MAARPVTDGGRALWEELTASGTPVVDKQRNLWTFLWRTPEGEPTPDEVHLGINRITDKDQRPRGLMLPVPGTNLWVRTLELPPTLRAAYSFHPVHAQAPARQGPPPHNTYAGWLDATSTLPPIVRGDASGQGLSLIRGPRVDPHPLWEGPALADPPVIREHLAFERTAASHQDADLERSVYLYLPKADEPAVFLTLFDAHIWFDRLRLPAVLAAAHASGALPPIAVLGVGNNSVPDRKATLGANAEFLRDVAGPATQWAQDLAAHHGVKLGGIRILAGESLGGLSALWAGLTLREAYSHVIAQSPSLWWHPEQARTPGHLGQDTIDWLTAQFMAADQDLLPQITLDVGTQEKLSVARMHMLAHAIGVPLGIHDGGHDHAWWRINLTRRLAQITRP